MAPRTRYPLAPKGHASVTLWRSASCFLGRMTGGRQGGCQPLGTAPPELDPSEVCSAPYRLPVVGGGTERALWFQPLSSGRLASRGAKYQPA